MEFHKGVPRMVAASDVKAEGKVMDRWRSLLVVGLLHRRRSDESG